LNDGLRQEKMTNVLDVKLLKMSTLNKLLFCFDFIFYTVFSYYYDKGKINKKNYPPVAQTYFIFVIFFCGLIIGIYMITTFTTINTKNTFLWGISSKILALFSFILTYFVFFFKKRYMNIYKRFEQKHFANSTRAKLLGWLLYFIGLASPIILGYAKMLIYY